MKTRLFIFAALAFAGSANAADNFQVKDGAGATILKRSKDTGGVQADANVLLNSTYVVIDPATDSSVTTMSAKLPVSLGAKVGTASISVVPATDGVFSVSQSGAWTIAGITGTVALPTGAATAAGLSTINTTLGTPLQAGGAVTIGGTLPAFAATPTFNCGTGCGASSVPTGPAGTPNASVLSVQGISGGTAMPVAFTAAPTVNLGTLNGAATATGVASVVTALGTPLQAGGNIANVTGTVSLPTGAATAAAQATIVTSLATLHTDFIAPTPAGTLIIGKVGIDQTTPGTTNAVTIKALNQSATSVSTNITGATANTVLLATNALRLGGAIVNDSTAVLYVKLSTGASATSYDYYLAGSASGVPSQFEIPQGYTGPLYGGWATATGTARVSERTQ